MQRGPYLCLTENSTVYQKPARSLSFQELADTSIIAADMLSDKAVDMTHPMLRILTDQGTEFCGRVK